MQMSDTQMYAYWELQAVDIPPPLVETRWQAVDMEHVTAQGNHWGSWGAEYEQTLHGAKFFLHVADSFHNTACCVHVACE